MTLKLDSFWALLPGFQLQMSRAMMATMDHAAAGVALLALLAGSQAERSSFPCPTVDECTRAELWSAAAQLPRVRCATSQFACPPASRQRRLCAGWLL